MTATACWALASPPVQSPNGTDALHAFRRSRLFWENDDMDMDTEYRNVTISTGRVPILGGTAPPRTDTNRPSDDAMIAGGGRPASRTNAETTGGGGGGGRAYASRPLIVERHFKFSVRSLPPTVTATGRRVRRAISCNPLSAIVGGFQLCCYCRASAVEWSRIKRRQL